MPNTSSKRTGEGSRARRYWLGLVIIAVVVAVSSRAIWRERSTAGAIHHVKIAGMQFSPPTLKVHVGDRIEFQNTDFVPHTATSLSGGPFDSGRLDSGKTWSFMCERAGAIAYHCTFHPTMTGSIDVSR